MSFASMHNDYLDPDRHRDEPRGRRRGRRQTRQKPDSFTTPKTFGTFPREKLFAYLAELCQNEVDARGLNTHAGAKAAIAKALLTAALDTDEPWTALLKAPPRRLPGAQQKPKSPPP